MTGQEKSDLLIQVTTWHWQVSGADPGFQVEVRGAHLKKLRWAEGGAKIVGVFRVKNHDFTPKNHIFFQLWRETGNCLGFSFEKSRFNTKKSYFFQFKGGRTPGVPPPLDPPLGLTVYCIMVKKNVIYSWFINQPLFLTCQQNKSINEQ